MPFFGGVNHLTHSTPIPVGVTQEKAVATLFHDHEFFISCNPHMINFKDVVPIPEVEIPDAVTPLRTGEPTRVFTVTDRVHTLPAHIWDSDVISTYEFTNIKTGVFVRIKSPLSIVMDTMWEIKDGQEQGEGLVISEHVDMTCSIFLAPIVKSQVQHGWKGIHAKMCDTLKAA